ncbi:hypothetical protein BKA70DRAFT_1430362 [Coprinopsis sp. MPI-PUGE-AT-0042]|nr:hypothetical protein BKA70DRAFT_1430362 [Coprinopsis sp. MPI-PUGE-AT-0042]
MLPKITQEQAAAPFPFHRTDVTRLEISGGRWMNVEGNCITLNNCKVIVSGDGQILQTSSLSLTPPRELGSTSAPGFSSSTPPASAQFLLATTQLEIIDKLISPHTDATGIFKRAEPHLRELQKFVDFASTAYTACGGGTMLGNTVRAAIDTRMKQCNEALLQAIIQIARLPHRSFPRIRYAHRVVHKWWTGNDPEEIRAIRLSLLNEVEGIGEWLHCLHSFWWASSQFLTTNSKFTKEGLHDFLESGPISMLRQIVIEKIIVLEPLHGKPWSIPCRFVETFEHIHLAVGMACKGTAASRFIDNKQYQLDESATDAAVSEEDIAQHFGQSRLHDGKQKNDRGWITCHHCRTKFNAYSSGPVEAKIEEVDEESRETTQAFSEVRSGASSSQPETVSQESVARRGDYVPEVHESMDERNVQPPTEDREDDEIDIDDDFWVSDAKMAKLFRRIKFEVESEARSSLTTPGRSCLQQPRDGCKDNQLDHLPINLNPTLSATTSTNNPISQCSSPPVLEDLSLTRRKQTAGTSKAWMRNLGITGQEFNHPFTGQDGDIRIVVLGPTRVGKSTFIKEYTKNNEVIVGHELQSATRDVTCYLAAVPPTLAQNPSLKNRRLITVDTPGSGGTFADDSEILKRISVWLAQSYNKQGYISGIICKSDI